MYSKLLATTINSQKLLFIYKNKNNWSLKQNATQKNLTVHSTGSLLEYI